MSRKLCTPVRSAWTCWRDTFTFMTDRNPDHVYIRQAAEQLNRRMGTLRKWEQQNVLPIRLRSHRGERGWRYWTPEQIEDIKEWIRDTNRYSGKALPAYNPTENELDKAIEAMRRPHNTTRRLEEIT
jgi:hypothetical protein